MAVSQLTGRQVKDGSIGRSDLDVTTAGEAVIRKLLAGTAISLTYTGPDSGTGDVTISYATAATRSALIAFPTTTALVRLTEDGREGLFKWDSSVLIATHTADTQQGIYVAPNAAANGAWVRVFSGKPSVRWWGAKGDGYYNAGISGFDGTDDTPAFVAALAYCNSNKYGLFVPPGNYRFARKATYTDAFSLTFPNAGVWDIEGDSYATSILMMDEAIGTDQPSNGLIGAGIGANQSTPGYGASNTGTLKLSNLGFQGLWTQHPLAAIAGPRGGSFINMRVNLTEFEMTNCAIRDCRWIAINVARSDRSYVSHNIVERVAADGIRITSGRNVIIVDNQIKDVDDNAISAHANNELLEGTPVRSRILVARNTLSGCVGINILGANTTIVADNISERCHSSNSSVGHYASPEGTNAQNVLIVHGNIIRDNLLRYDTGAWSSPSIQNASLGIAGGPVTANASSKYPDAWDGTAYQPPYAVMDAGAPWGAMNVVDWFNQGSDTTVYSNAGSRHVIVSNNLVTRTLPDTSAFSNWGHGQMFVRTGYVDPAIVPASWVTTGIGLWSDMIGFSVLDNQISGYSDAGIYFYITSQSVIGTQEFRDGLIRGNHIKDCGQAITCSTRGSGSATFRSWSVTIDGNILDCDPYHKHSLRKSPLDGTWTSSSDLTLRPDAVNLRAITGCRVINNVFRNCYTAFSANSDIYSQHEVANNLLECDPTAIGYNSANKGIASPDVPGMGFRYLIVNSDPTSATYRDVLNVCAGQAAVKPTTGKYIAGTFVQNTGASRYAVPPVLGWMRATTGSAHVLGTDWIIVYAVNQNLVVSTTAPSSPSVNDIWIDTN